jgi:prepilin-type processing-associated H-X9-DG protein
MIAISDSYYIAGELGGIDNGFCSNFGTPVSDPTRHGKTFNQVYCDGHVGAMLPSILFNVTNSAALWNRDNQPHPELWP